MPNPETHLDTLNLTGAGASRNYPFLHASENLGRALRIGYFVLMALLLALLFVPTHWPHMRALRAAELALWFVLLILGWRLNRKRKQLS